jgi:hypothetical protein
VFLNFSLKLIFQPVTQLNVDLSTLAVVDSTATLFCDDSVDDLVPKL